MSEQTPPPDRCGESPLRKAYRAWLIMDAVMGSRRMRNVVIATTEERAVIGVRSLRIGRPLENGK